MHSLLHRSLHVLLSNLSPCPINLSTSTVVAYVLNVLKRILSASALASLSLQSENWRRTAEQLDSSDERSSQIQNAEPEQWRRDVQVGSQEDSIQEDIVRLLSWLSRM